MMVNAPNVTGILLFVFYAVTFSKTPFAKLVKDPDWQNWLIRIWALGLGIAGSVVNNRYGISTGLTTYAAIVNGALGAVSAIVTYHVGTGDFIGAFDTSKNTTTDTQGQVQKLQLPAAVVASDTGGVLEIPPKAAPEKEVVTLTPRIS